MSQKLRESTHSYRLPNFIGEPKLYVIAAEGQNTEPEYFEALITHYKKKHRGRLHIEVLKRPEEDVGLSAPKYVKKMLDDFLQENKNYNFENDELWMVIDTDKWHKENLSELIQVCKQQNYLVAVSNPCFELWLILHLATIEEIKNDIEKSKNRSKKCKQLRGSIQQNLHFAGIYEEYMEFIPQAIEQARKLDAITPTVEFPENIYTQVYKLIEKITELPTKYFNSVNCHNEKEVESKFIVNYLLPILGYNNEDWQQEVRGDGIRLDFLIYNLVIEAKHPNINLTNKHVNQLKRYLLGKNARYGVLTNAQELRIYEHNNKLTKLVFRCFVKNIENQVFEINQLIGKNILNPKNKRIEQSNQSIQTQSEKNNMKVIGIYHNKGGVGKTTVAVNLAAAFRNMGKRVLLIDIDAQANATFATGLIKFLFDKDDDLKDSNVFNLLEFTESGFISDICRQSSLFNELEIDVIPSHISLIGKQSGLTTFANTRWRLNGKIQLVKEEYDIVIIDMPPSLDIYAEMALIAADYLIIPSDLKPFANQGLPNVRNFIRQTDETKISIGKEALEIIGVLPSKILSNARYLKHTFEQQKQHIIQDYNFEVLNSKILDKKILADCFNNDIEMGELRIPDPKSIFMFDKKSESAKEFNALANEVSEKIGITQ
ncbi:MAG: AAA family ATPase [Thiomargarita sp.]|nr:AAA family ATPase [Thiomargarita sp.]